jgi:hypothetical protein
MSKKQDIFNQGIPVGNEDESLEKDFPLLHSISKENPFLVPKDYFDSLPSEIIGKCREEIVSGQPDSYRASLIGGNLLSYVLYLISLYKWRLLAVTGCVAILCFFAIRMNDRPVSYETMAQNIPDSLIVDHLDKNIAFINESTLEEISENIPDASENNSKSVKIKSDSASTDQDIIAYLMNSNVSVSEIVNVP